MAKTRRQAHDGIVIPTVDMKKLHQKLAMGKDAAEKLIISQFQYIGEEAVRIARQNGSYNDITGNLRSSIGYAIIKNGVPVTVGATEAFSGTKGDGSAGIAQGQAFLKKIAGRYSRGIALIVVAGMNYAVYVESIHHKDVLTSAELKAENLVKKLLSGVIE